VKSRTNGSRSASPRRILVVETNHDGTVGGSHQALYDLVRLLDPMRYTPIVLFYETNPFVERLRALGIRVLTWDAEWEIEHKTRARWFTPGRLVGLGGVLGRRVALLRRERIALVHVNNSPSVSYYDWLPAARIAGLPCVTHLRGELLRISGPLVRWAHCNFDRYISISSYVTGVLERESFPFDRIRQIEDGIDTAKVRGAVTRGRLAVREELGVAADALLVVMAGHLRSWKGQDVVLLALAELEQTERRGVRVVFAGADDPSAPEFRHRLDNLVAAHELEPCVQFLGDRNDVPNLMNAADIVLHASTKPEPFGLVVLEGMAHGRLVIASALGGPLQIVDEGSGWLFDPSEPLQLAMLLRRAIAHPSVVTSYRDAARARADAFTVARVATRVQNVYAELLA
jgi:glycosyltransferase involved in cell wall biosynthesis